MSNHPHERWYVSYGQKSTFVGFLSQSVLINTGLLSASGNNQQGFVLSFRRISWIFLPAPSKPHPAQLQPLNPQVPQGCPPPARHVFVFEDKIMWGNWRGWRDGFSSSGRAWFGCWKKLSGRVRFWPGVIVDHPWAIFFWRVRAICTRYWANIAICTRFTFYNVFKSLKKHVNLTYFSQKKRVITTLFVLWQSAYICPIEVFELNWNIVFSPSKLTEYEIRYSSDNIAHPCCCSLGWLL